MLWKGWDSVYIVLTFSASSRTRAPRARWLGRFFPHNGVDDHALRWKRPSSVCSRTSPSPTNERRNEAFRSFESIEPTRKMIHCFETPHAAQKLYKTCIKQILKPHCKFFFFTFCNLADASIQSDLQMRTKEAIKIKRAMICKCYDSMQNVSVSLTQYT